MPDAAVIESPPPTTPESPQAQPARSEAWSALDAMAVDDGKDDAPEPAKEAPKASERGPDGKFQPKTAQAKETPPAPKETPKESPKEVAKETPKEPAKESPKETPKESEPPFDATKAAPKQLREAYERLTAKHKALEQEHAAIKTKATTPPPELKTLSEKLAEREARLAEYDEKLRFTAYQEHPEYKQNFEKPLVDAWRTGQSVMARLEFTNEDGTTRPGTPADFDHFMTMRDDRQAAAWAREKFGDAALAIWGHRDRVQEANSRKESALAEYREKGVAAEKQRAEQFRQQQEHFTAAIDEAEKSDTEAHKEWFGEHETDTKDNEVFDKARHFVNRIKANGAQLKEGDKPWTPQELARNIAAVRLKASGFDRMVHRERAARARIAELEKEVAQFKSSEPGSGEAKKAGSKAVSSAGTMADILGKLDSDYGSNR